MNQDFSTVTPPPGHTPAIDHPLTHLVLMDFGDGPKSSPETDVLSRLFPGSAPVLYDHGTKKSPFSTWLATRRNRLDKKFKYDNIERVPGPGGDLQKTAAFLPPGQYYIWVEE